MSILDKTAEEYRTASHFWQTKCDKLEKKIAALQKELLEEQLEAAVAKAQLAKVEQLYNKLDRKLSERKGC